ncbi:MAG: mercuric transport protein MerTP [Chitinophagaceae bacterium]|nr:MAG: mercuric transport protein MerTP [Chitinophagaceae bacterium]
MKTNRSSVRLIGLGILSAIAASLCCITPVLAILAGSAGLASSFSWLTPARPYLAAVAIVVLAFAWYRKLRPAKPSGTPPDKLECACEENTHPSFFRSKAFLLIVTLFAIAALTFPYYGKVFYPDVKKQVAIPPQDHIQRAELVISGMDCQACEKGIKYVLSALPGYVDAQISYQSGEALVTFDQVKTGIVQIDSAVNSTGYKVVHHRILTTGSTFHDPSLH